MANSPRFHTLVSRLSELRKRFLPRTFSPTGTYTERQIDHVRAYRLLVHAEIEWFLEEISRHAVLTKVSAWKRTRKPSDLIICFLACYHSGWTDDDGMAIGEVPHSPKTRTQVKEKAEEAVELAVIQYTEGLKSNNGIRIRNLRQMLLPIGVRLADLDQTWITNLDEFGKKRGDTAHLSVGAYHPLDPKTEYDTVKGLVVGLKKLDAIIVELCV